MRVGKVVCAVGKAVRQKGIARYGRSHEDRYRPEHRLKDTPRFVARRSAVPQRVSRLSGKLCPNGIPKKRHADDLSGFRKADATTADKMRADKN